MNEQHKSSARAWGSGARKDRGTIGGGILSEPLALPTPTKPSAAWRYCTRPWNSWK